MNKEINPKEFQRVCTELLATNNCKSAIRYITKTLTIKATWHNKPKSRTNGKTMILTFGKPNYAERKFIKNCIKANEPFPVKKTQFKFYPKKKN